jgi:hypothetical protein
MSPLHIIKALEPIKDRSPCFLSRPKGLTVNGFNLERMKETLCYCVVPAVTFATHAALKPVPFQEGLKHITRILAPSVKVAKRRSNATTRFYSHAHR